MEQAYRQPELWTFNVECLDRSMLELEKLTDITSKRQLRDIYLTALDAFYDDEIDAASLLVIYGAIHSYSGVSPAQVLTVEELRSRTPDNVHSSITGFHSPLNMEDLE